MSVFDQPTAPPRRRRRGRGLLVAVVLLLIAVAAVVVVDRIAADRAAVALEDTVTESYAGSGVDVDLGGFPFLTQVAGGTFDRITLRADAVTYDGIELTGLDGFVTDVPYDVGTGVIGRAATLQASATLPLNGLQTLVAQQVPDLEDVTLTTGDGALIATTEVLGAVPVQIELLPRAAEGQIAVDIGAVSIAGVALPLEQLPAELTDRLTDIRIDVPGVPEGITLTDLTATGQGVLVTVEGQDVDLA